MNETKPIHVEKKKLIEINQSIALFIPKAIKNALSLTKDKEIEISAFSDGTIVIKVLESEQQTEEKEKVE